MMTLQTSLIVCLSSTTYTYAGLSSGSKVLRHSYSTLLPSLNIDVTISVQSQHSLNRICTKACGSSEVEDALQESTGRWRFDFRS
jgi:1-aminocyclopropane-1-carboxylate deaminase/D-cysteine desulfhydrase-like pyridoxal-dependent ACC family enzyme